jgi:hypothetical protein
MLSSLPVALVLWMSADVPLAQAAPSTPARRDAAADRAAQRDTRFRIPFEPFVFQPFVVGGDAGVTSAEEVEGVARDAYLGGAGVAGPLALLGTTVNLLVEPALGALASVASEGPALGRPGQVQRSTAAAYGKTLSYMATFVGLWALSVPLWVLTVALVPGAVALTVAAVTGFSPVGVAAATGLGVGLAGVGGVALFALLGVPWLLGRALGTWVGDRVWDGLGEDMGPAEAQQGARQDLQELLKQKPVGPLPSLRGGVMMAAVAGGVWERNLKWDGIPVVGPFITARKAQVALPQRMAAARALAGEPPASENFAWQAPLLMYARSALLASGQGAFLVATAMAAGTGAAALTVALVPSLGPSVALGVLAGGLGAAGVLALAGAALVGAASLANALLPWALVLLSSAAG